MIRPLSRLAAGMLTLALTVPALAQDRPAWLVAGRHSAERAVERLGRQGQVPAVSWRQTQPGPEVVAGLSLAVPGATPRAKAERFLKDHADLLGIAAADLAFLRLDGNRRRTVVRFGQRHQGLEVLDREVAVTLDEQGRVVAVASDALPVLGLQRGAVTAQAARTAAVRASLALRADQPAPELPAHAREVVVAQPTGAVHAWVVDVARVPLHDHRRVLVGATDGRILDSRASLHR